MLAVLCEIWDFAFSRLQIVGWNLRKLSRCARRYPDKTDGAGGQQRISENTVGSKFMGTNALRTLEIQLIINIIIN